MNNICKNCKNYQNHNFDNKRYGYCDKLYYELYVEDKKGKILNNSSIVTNEKFGCIKFEQK